MSSLIYVETKNKANGYNKTETDLQYREQTSGYHW